MSERWKPIPGWPDYEASNYGRIRSVGRWMVHHRFGIPMWWKEKILKPAKTTGGHLFCVLPPRKNRAVHKLVALAWLGPPPFPGAVVRHRDDNKHNNRLSNLAWGTQKDNMQDAIRNGHSLGGYRPKGSRQVSPGVFQ